MDRNNSYWFRITDHPTAPPLDEWDNVCGPSGVGIYIEKLKVSKETPHGVWLEIPFNGKRWTKRDARKRFACPTIEEALESFLARKARQISIYKNGIDYVERAIKEAELRVLEYRRVSGQEVLL